MADERNIYGYNPSLPAAVIFIILFGASTAYHGYQLTKARCWYFIPFVIGGVRKSSILFRSTVNSILTSISPDLGIYLPRRLA